MSLDQLSTGTKVFLGAGVLLFVDSLLKWNKLDVKGLGGGNFDTGWHGFFGVVFGIALLLSLAWVILPMLNIEIPELPVDKALVGPGLAVLTVVFGLLRWIMKRDVGAFGSAAGVDVGWSIWGWIGLLLLIAFAAGAFLRWQEGGGQAAAAK